MKRTLTQLKAAKILNSLINTSLKRPTYLLLDCKPFNYSGCEGNANNYENYIACADACNRTTKCPEGNPLEWDWIQDLISESRACKNEIIRQFEYNGNLYFSVGPWEHCGIADLNAYTYDCQGDLVCYSGGWVSNDDPNSCYNKFRPSTSRRLIMKMSNTFI